MKAGRQLTGLWAFATLISLTAASCTTQIGGQGPGVRGQGGEPLQIQPQASQPKLSVTYAKLPLHFESNQGQTDERVNFLARGRGYTLFLTSTEVVLALRKSQKNPSPVPDSVSSPLPSWERTKERGPNESIPESIEQTVLRMQLVGANLNPQVAGQEELPGKVNYFIGNDREKWRSNIPTFGKVKYENVYPGVDVVYYGNRGQLEFDFVVAPGADPSAIRLVFDGLVGAQHAAPIQIDASGNLLLDTAGGEVRLLKPQIYQEIDGVKQSIPGRYVLSSRPLGNGQGDGKYHVGFEVEAYNVTKPLVIDPVLEYSTYLGGHSSSLGSEVGVDFGSDIAVDASGRTYVIGSTDSVDFPTVNALQGTFGGSDFPLTGDAFVARFSEDGSTLEYATYLGGSSIEGGLGIAVDSLGRAYVTGSTVSADFPTINALQGVFNGNGPSSDAFVARLSANGDSLEYSTYLGGSGSDGASGIAVDSSNRAYVTGITNSTDFPTVNALQGTLASPSFGDAFVGRLSANGSSLEYSTYLGGSNGESSSSIAVDTSSRAYITGVTGSADFPIINALQETCDTSLGFCDDTFVARLSINGSTLEYATYLKARSSGASIGRAIAVDSSGRAYVAGATRSSDFPTVNALQETLGGGICGESTCPDAFVMRLNASGSSLEYATYLVQNQATYFER